MHDRDFKTTQTFAAISLALSTPEALDLATKLAQLVLLLISIAYAIHKFRKSIRKEGRDSRAATSESTDN